MLKLILNRLVKSGIISLKEKSGTDLSQPAKTTGAKSSKCIASINDLSFRDFKTCAVDGGLTVLGDVPHETAEAWQAISEQFAEAMGGEKFSFTISKVWEAESLNSKISRLTHIFEMFKENPYVEFVSIFEAEGWEYPTDDLERYTNCIKNELSNLHVKLENALSKVDHKEGEKPTHERYDECLVAISNFEGREINDDIMTSKFCIYYKRLIKHVEKNAATRRAT